MLFCQPPMFSIFREFPFLAYFSYSISFSQLNLRFPFPLQSTPKYQLLFSATLPGSPGSLQSFQAYQQPHSSHCPFLSPIPLRDFNRNIFGKALYIILIFNFLESVEGKKNLDLITQIMTYIEIIKN